MTACLRVIVIDDFRDCADITGELLRSLGAVTRVAYNAEAALVLAEDFRPDLVLVDLTMTEPGWVELAARIGGRLDFHPVVVAMTESVDPEHRKIAEDAGFTYILLKPVKTKELMNLLEAVKATKR